MQARNLIVDLAALEAEERRIYLGIKPLQATARRCEVCGGR